MTLYRVDAFSGGTELTGLVLTTTQYVEAITPTEAMHLAHAYASSIGAQHVNFAPATSEECGVPA